MPDDFSPRDFLSPDACKLLFKKIDEMAHGGGETRISLSARSGNVSKWAMGEMQVDSEISDSRLRIVRDINGATGVAMTTRLDEAGLLEAVRSAEYSMTEDKERRDVIHASRYDSSIEDPRFQEPLSRPVLWSDHTYKTTSDERFEIAQKIIEPAENSGLMSSGMLEIAAEGQAFMSSNGLFRYYPVTDVRCSVTVRNLKSAASGWAAQHNFDIAGIQPAEIALRAVDKCVRSRNPVAIEPGRYTAILEPQAVADLLTPLLEDPEPRGSNLENPVFERPSVEAGKGPFYKRRGQSRIGERVLDNRLTLSADPMDRDGGFIPFSRYSGDPYVPIKWIDRGVLKDLSYPRTYALRVMGKKAPLPNSLSYRLGGAGSHASIEDMIKSTVRGVLVTRFSNVKIVDNSSLLCSGFTRDGLWLIENGKITRPIKNLRFIESPLFVLNNLLEIGTPVRVFQPPYSRIVPAVKARDFSFTSLADSV